MSVGQQDHSLAGIQNHIQIMGGYELCLRQLVDGVDDRATVEGIQGGGRFIHDNHFRLHCKDGGDSGHPFFAAG